MESYLVFWTSRWMAHTFTEDWTLCSNLPPYYQPVATHGVGFNRARSAVRPWALLIASIGVHRGRKPVV